MEHYRRRVPISCRFKRSCRRRRSRTSSCSSCSRSCGSATAALGLSTCRGWSDTCDLSIQSLAPHPLYAGCSTALTASCAYGAMDRGSCGSSISCSPPQRSARHARRRGAAVAVHVPAPHEAPDWRSISSSPSTATSTPRGPPRAGRHPDALALQRLFLDPAVPADSDLVRSGRRAVADSESRSPARDPVRAPALERRRDNAVRAPITNGQLTLGNLSQIYRVITWPARRPSLTELLRIVPLTSAARSRPRSPTRGRRSRSSKSSADPAVRLQRRRARLRPHVAPTTAGITDQRIRRRPAGGPGRDPADPRRDLHQRRPAPDDPAAGAGAGAAVLRPCAARHGDSIVDDTFTGNLAGRNTFIAANFGSFVDPATAEASSRRCPAASRPPSGRPPSTSARTSYWHRSRRS